MILLNLKDTEKTIVIHPGSMNLRIGRCTDGLPYVIPHILARRVRNFNEDSSFGTSKTNKSEEMQVSSENETLENFIKESDFWIKQSQKAAKLRPVQQANTQVSFLKRSSFDLNNTSSGFKLQQKC